MKPKTATTFLVAAVLCAVLGMSILSPAGRMPLYALAAVAGLVPVVGGSRQQRIAGVLIVVAALALLVATYPSFAADMAAYRQRAQQKQAGVATPAPQTQQQQSQQQQSQQQ